MEIIITLQNSSKLNEKQFIRYFEKKVLYTIRKFNLFKDIKQRPQVQDLFRLKKINTYLLSKECLDGISVLILQNMMKKNGKQKISSLLPKYKNILRPFYLMSGEEMILYAKIKKLGYNPKNKINISSSQKTKNKTSKKSAFNSELNFFLSDLEKNQKNVKNSIVSSLLKIENLV